MLHQRRVVTIKENTPVDWGNAHFFAAEYFYKTKQYLMAIKEYKNIPNFREEEKILERLIRCYGTFNQEAAEYYRKQLQKVYEQKAFSLLEEGDYQQAFSTFLKIKNWDRNYILLGVALALEGKGETKLAYEKYKQWNERGDTNDYDYVHYCRFLLKFNYPEAEEVLRDAMKRWPEYVPFKALERIYFPKTNPNQYIDKPNLYPRYYDIRQTFLGEKERAVRAENFATEQPGQSKPFRV